MQTTNTNIAEIVPCGAGREVRTWEIRDERSGMHVECNGELIAVVLNKEVRTVRNVYAFVLKVLHAQRARDWPYNRYLTMNQVNYWAKKHSQEAA